MEGEYIVLVAYDHYSHHNYHSHHHNYHSHHHDHLYYHHHKQYHIIHHIITNRNTLELVDKILKPLLILPCKGDSIEYRLGGAYYELLKSKYSTTETVAFEDENHGFWSRGGY